MPRGLAGAGDPGCSGAQPRPRDRRGAGLRALSSVTRRTHIPGSTAAASSFESGTLDGFGVATSGTGKASVSTGLSRSGNCAALLHTTATPGSIARLTVGLTPGTTEAYADGWFNIAAEGMAGNNVPYFRFFSGGVRVLDVFRQNISHELVLRTSSPAGFTYTTLRQDVPTDSWHRLVMHVVPNGPETERPNLVGRALRLRRHCQYFRDDARHGPAWLRTRSANGRHLHRRRHCQQRHGNAGAGSRSAPGAEGRSVEAVRRFPR